jgi:hypothetical protein
MLTSHWLCIPAPYNDVQALTAGLQSAMHSVICTHFVDVDLYWNRASTSVPDLPSNAELIRN